jgi:uncharacterized protein (TIGR04255 family)
VTVPTSTSAARYPRHKYGESPLRLVLCQLQFPVLHRFDESSLQAMIQDTLRSQYPRVQQEQQVAVMLGPNGPAPTPGGVLWRYQTLEADWSIVVQRNSVGLETTAYSQFEDFERGLGELLGLLEQLGVTVLERVGLRYINEFRHEAVQHPRQWAGLLREQLLGIVGGDELTGEIVHAIQDIRLTEPDGTLVIRHGYIGPGTGADPYYLLDLDYFDEQAHGYDRDDVLGRLRSYHAEISNIFEMSLSDGMRVHLKDQGPIDA